MHCSRHRGSAHILVALLALMLAAIPASAQQPAPEAEAAAAKRLETLRENPLLLREFLKRMPKGGDLHNHLSGAVYAESFLKWAAADGYCIDSASFAAVPCSEPGSLPASRALTDASLNRRIIDAWSMRNWQYSGENGHDHFFNTFGKFGLATVDRAGDMLAEVARRGADNGLTYQELMLTPDGGAVSRLGMKLDWRRDYAAMRDDLLRMGLRDSIRIGMALLDTAEKRMRSILGCGDGPGCGMTIRYLYQVGRGGREPSVFAQIVAGFEMAEMDPRVVGFNLVQPEDDPVPMALFDDEMEMINTLRPLYRAAHISLHAGEFAYGMIPPDSLCCHIRSSIERGHAERIGHGVDVMYESAPLDLMRTMKERNILVEICLTSNDGILGVKGIDHPFRIYAAQGVPLALCTDDEGVSRGDITNEYVRAVREQGATYADLKRMARNSLEHAFVQGKSLWSDPVAFTMAAECGGARPGGTLPARCREFFGKNEKARLQWALEEALARFEGRK
jgi:adenosine deaminase/adenosine deaminase CECR1